MTYCDVGNCHAAVLSVKIIIKKEVELLSSTPLYQSETLKVWRREVGRATSAFWLIQTTNQFICIRQFFTVTVHFHSFPTDARIRDLWIIGIRRDDGASFKILNGSTYIDNNCKRRKMSFDILRLLTMKISVEQLWKIPNMTARARLGEGVRREMPKQ